MNCNPMNWFSVEQEAKLARIWRTIAETHATVRGLGWNSPVVRDAQKQARKHEKRLNDYAELIAHQNKLATYK